MKLKSRRHGTKGKSWRLHVEGLESRQLLAGDLGQACAESSCLIGDSDLDGRFDEPDRTALFQAGKHKKGEAVCWKEDGWNENGWFDSSDPTLASQSGSYGADSENTGQQMWPDQIPLPAGFQPEGATLGKGQEFFVGAFSYTSFFGPRWDLGFDESEFAGAIYKGNFRTGEGQILVEPTDNLMISGLSYDVRTDYLYAGTLETGSIIDTGSNTGGGVNIYDGTTGALVERIEFGNGVGVNINDVFVTSKAVYATDSFDPVLYKIPLNAGGQYSTDWEVIQLDGFEMVGGEGVVNANGLVGDFDGKELVVININAGVLYHVDTESGVSTKINIEGEQTNFLSGDGLYMKGRTLYIMQNQAYLGGPGKVAVVQLSGDLTHGTFIKDITSNDSFAIPTTIMGFGDSIYVVNSQFVDFVFGADGDPSNDASQVVRVDA